MAKYKVTFESISQGFAAIEADSEDAARTVARNAESMADLGIVWGNTAYAEVSVTEAELLCPYCDDGETTNDECPRFTAHGIE